MHWITQVKYVKDYTLDLTFNDQVHKRVDLKPYVGGKGVFKPLEDIEYFKRVHLDEAGNTIMWDNGADICPDVLYDVEEVT